MIHMCFPQFLEANYFVICFNFVDKKLIALDNRLPRSNAYNDCAKTLISMIEKNKNYLNNRIFYLVIHIGKLLQATFLTRYLNKMGYIIRGSTWRNSSSYFENYRGKTTKIFMIMGFSPYANCLCRQSLKLKSWVWE